MTLHMLLSQVWGNGHEADAQYLYVYVAHIRQKIESDPAHQRFILTIPGVDYRFNSEIEREPGSLNTLFEQTLRCLSVLLISS
jgi:DNA-binding winged helix-turn-helix (wHTH) protein